MNLIQQKGLLGMKMELEKYFLIFLILIGLCFFCAIIGLLPIRDWADTLWDKIPKSMQNIMIYLFGLVVIFILLWAWISPSKPIIP